MFVDKVDGPVDADNDDDNILTKQQQILKDSGSDDDNFEIKDKNSNDSPDEK